MTDYQLPLPFVTGGLGLLFAFSIPGGLTGGEGFLVGLAIGVAAPFLRDWAAKVNAVRAADELCRCPKCGTTLAVRLSSVKPTDGGVHGTSEREGHHE